MSRIRLKVKELAIERGFNQSSLSRYAMVDFKTVKRLYRNPYRDVNISTLVKIAKVLKITVNDLIEEVEDNN
jgi:DNA-binding Xre family transcriptional regulator